MTKLKCWTKPRIPKSKGGAGGTYTTCVEGQKKKKLKILKPIEKTKPKPVPKPVPKVDTHRWGEEAVELFKKHKGVMPKTHNGKVLMYHDFFNADRSTTLSRRKTKNYDIPTYAREADGYNVGKNKWRDYSWD
tara:strand:+ start:1816 stop:2214 length:399 start_codon:yes stop_codon:yes gene_type:complete